MIRTSLSACLAICSFIAVGTLSADAVASGTCDQAPAHIDSLRDALGIPEYLHLEWVPSRDGWDTLRVVDDFNRTDVGGHWIKAGEYWEIRDGELVLNSNCCPGVALSHDLSPGLQRTGQKNPFRVVSMGKNRRPNRHSRGGYGAHDG